MNINDPIVAISLVVNVISFLAIAVMLMGMIETNVYRYVSLIFGASLLLLVWDELGIVGVFYCSLVFALLPAVGATIAFLLTLAIKSNVERIYGVGSTGTTVRLEMRESYNLVFLGVNSGDN